jgi:hypothetical protein
MFCELADEEDDSRTRSTAASNGMPPADVGFWVTLTPAKGQIRGPRGASKGTSRSAETRPVQEEKAGGEGQN